MTTPSEKIASQIKNCSFNLQSIQKFLALMATQQTEYSDISYKANGTFSLVLRAKKNVIAEVALKILECTNYTECQIKAMEREYAMCQQLPTSDYFVAIQDQFYLTEMDESAEQGQSRNSNTARNIYFVQEMEMCKESLFDTIQHYSEQNKDPPTEEYKELLAIQMLDAVNLLHQRQIAHGNITTQHFLFSSSQQYPVLLKLYNLRFISSFNLRSPQNLVSVNESLNCEPSKSGIQKDCLEQDLISLGRVLFQLDNIGSQRDYTRISDQDLPQPEVVASFETQQLNMSTQIYKIAQTLLNNSRENSQSARSMLLLLLQKQTSSLKIHLFSIVLKSQVDSICLPIPYKRIRLDYLVWQLRKELKLHNISSWFNNKGKRKTQLTLDQIKSALEIMMEWKEFSGQYDVLGVGVGVGGVVFGVDNLKEERKSALKLSLCTNKAEAIKEIGIMRMCQAPCIVKFYGHKFFKDANGNEFVVYEFEKCKYSLTNHLELQRINGEYSNEQKYNLTLQIINSVRFLHENGILHKNIKIDTFLIAENGSGQALVKLCNFSHAGQLQQEMSTLENQLLLQQYQSPRNNILQRHNRESPLYFAPERWENPDLSTCLTDSYSVGLCIFLLDNYLVCSEEQLARKLFSAPPGTLAFNSNNDLQNSTESELKKLVNLLIISKPRFRKFLRNLVEEEISKDLDENIFEFNKMVTIENDQALDEFIKSAPIRFANLFSLSFNLNDICIEDDKAESLLFLISTLFNLSRISLNVRSNSILAIQTKSMLSSLASLTNLKSLALNLFKNNIRNQEAQFLFCPLANLNNLSIIFLNLQGNNIGDIGAQSLLSPLMNLFNLSSITLNLTDNQIGDIGAQTLLSPLRNLLNLSNITINFTENQIGDKGAQSLLSSLANLLNLSSINLNLQKNNIGDVGAQSLLSPLTNLLNLLIITINLSWSQIGDIGAQSMLSPLANLFNLSSINLDLSENQIGDKGAQSLLSPLANLLNLQIITLDLSDNQIGDLGKQSLLSPLANLLNLFQITLNLRWNQIGDIGAQSLLSPLVNLLNLSNLTLNLFGNKIGSIGAQALLSPLSHLLNLSSITLDLSDYQIGDIGAQSLLSPFAKLLNLQRITLNLQGNQIQEKGAYCLFKHLFNMINISRLHLNFRNNSINKITHHLFKKYLKNLQFLDLKN